MSLELLYARRAVFKLIGRFHHADKFDDGEFYICNYCESALESAFNVLGVEDNYIKLMDFCKMWEENDRAIWTVNLPCEPFNGVTADTHYQFFKENYERWEKELEDFSEDD